ncbi:chitinase 2-like [Abrus precatorius]|uniref:Chitinase 2-like n=1 Tax=Abrus precatorius TaxID=3816 RepID=A0A8B8LKL5_ABRPR|nr:chitinase 2-like [Abrus precatorius]
MATNSIFREYIGGKSYPDDLNNFPDIINSNLQEFHFILAFATEDYDKNGKGTGVFKATWNERYFRAEKIKQLKEKYEKKSVKVKVIISIGGRLVGRKNVFDPAEKDVWPDRARNSLRRIIDLYNTQVDCSCEAIIDGIDINYENIKSNNIDFAHCIGTLIDGLKNKDKVIKDVSIAPSHPTYSHYLNLFRAHKMDIHWVNYQFYDQFLPSTDDFVELFQQLSDDYQEDKLLAGFSTDPNDKGMLSREVFFEACTKLIDTGSLHGIFVWNANDSADADDPFFFEIKAQKLLTGSDSK